MKKGLRLFLYAVAALLLLATAAVWLEQKYRFFAISSIRISNEAGDTLQRVDQQKLFQAVLPHLTGSFFSVDVRQAQLAAERLPWVKSATVTRRPVSGVDVVVEEHQPFAYWVREGEKAGVVDEKGMIFQADFSEKLPHFDGAAHVQGLMVQQYQAFGKVLQPLRLRILRLQYTPRGAWTLILDNGIEVRLGSQKVAERLAAFVRHWQAKLSADAAYLDYVDMRYEKGMAVRYHAQPQKTGVSGQEAKE